MSDSRPSWNPKGNKSFIPLENNPDVFNSLARTLGLSPSLQFYDVYSLDEPSLLSLIPRPVLALIVIIPSREYMAQRKAEGTRFARDGLSYRGRGAQEPVIWFRQTIGNACGLMALLHVAANLPRSHIVKGSTLDKLIDQITPLGPEERSQVVYDSVELEEAHMSAAKTGSSAVPSPDVEAPYHFEAFVKGPDGHLWELEGITDGPLDRGALQQGHDVLSEEALGMGVRKFMQVAGAEGTSEFSIIALAEQKQ